MKIAFVTPWYGDIPGGAEYACKRTAEYLQMNGFTVEVLTTCVKEFQSDWGSNFHKAGTYESNGIVVRRFKVRERNAQLFDRINYKLMNNQRISKDEERHFISEMINSDDLCEYLHKSKDDYDYFIFIPYMFGTTYFGSKVCPDKSVLIPCSHDESYIYLGIYKELFESVKGLIFLSEPEMNLTERIFNINEKRRSVIGVGIETNVEFAANDFRDKYDISNEFILYAGRREPGKNIPLLIDYFGKYSQERKTDLKLVLIGSGEVDIPKEYKGTIIDLGFIPKQDKYSAYAASSVLCQPSVNESFSIVIMESWLCGTPVLVHADCAVTKDHCTKSNGGLYFRDYDEFKGCLDFCTNNPLTSRKLGDNGKRYVLNNYSWDAIVSKFWKFLRC